MNTEDLVVSRELTIPGDELIVVTSRSGGPGGQNVNKVETRVTLRWSLTGSRALGVAQRERLLTRLASRLTTDGELVLHVDESRSQARNRLLARLRLAEVVRAALIVPRKRRATKPTRASQQRRVAGKQRRSEIKRGRGRPQGED